MAGPPGGVISPGYAWVLRIGHTSRGATPTVSIDPTDAIEINKTNESNINT